MRDDLGAFIDPDLAIDGAADGPLARKTFAAKDIFDVQGEKTGFRNPDWRRTHPPATAHVTRHTYGAQLAHEGVSLQVIAEAMGHSSTELTRKHYAHLLPSYVAKTIRDALPEYGFDSDNVTAIREDGSWPRGRAQGHVGVRNRIVAHVEKCDCDRRGIDPVAAELAQAG